MVILNGVGSWIYSYQQKNGKYPEDWSDLISGGFPGTARSAGGQRMLIEQRYFFPKDVVLKNSTGGLRVLLMAKRAGGEGNNYDAKDDASYEGRVLLLEDKEGFVYPQRFPEVVLRRKFKDLGLDLADYTYAAPPSPAYRIRAAWYHFRRVVPVPYLFLAAVAGMAWWKIRSGRMSADS